MILRSLQPMQRVAGRAASASANAAATVLAAPSIAAASSSSSSSSSSCRAKALQAPLCLAVGRRWMRVRAQPSRGREKIYSIDNPTTAKNWPPVDQLGDPITPKRCRDIMHQLNVQEMDRMRKLRPYIMPKFDAGDLVEVRYEMSRSQQTFAVFQGFCTEVRNKYLNSGFVLKNTYDGVGVEQLIPRYSPRVLGVRVVHALPQRPLKLDPRPPTRNHRYMYQYYVRGKYGKGKRFLWRWPTPQRPGIMSLEPRIRRELGNIRRRYMMQRAEAKLPPYIFPGPYHITRRQTREIKAERYRRMLIYAWDERQQREAKKRRLAEKHAWGTYKIDKEPKSSALSDLPSYHPLAGNLPK